MKTLIIGAGEIGTALFFVLNEQSFDLEILDEGENLYGTFDIIHICFPYSDKFISEVEQYQKTYKPKYTVIHSTVPIGTSRQLKALHSPVVGKHPNLKESLLTFTKFIGGDYADVISTYFSKAGMKCYITDDPESTELLKLMSTLFFGLMVEFTKETKRQCKKHDVPFELFTLWNMSYNAGYEKLGCPEFKKPLLIPNMNTIGGHCVLHNTNLIDSVFADFVGKLNKG